MELHAEVAAFEHLLGTWKGQGRGFYPTIEDFAYTEVLTFTALPGKPVIRCEQKTMSAQGVPMHTELGFLRLLGQGRVELTIAQPTGQTELLEGSIADGVLTLADDAVGNSSSAKEVTRTRRIYTFDGERLHTEFFMEAVGVPMAQHLESELTRQG